MDEPSRSNSNPAADVALSRCAPSGPYSLTSVVMQTELTSQLAARFMKLHLEDLLVLEEVLFCRVHRQIPTQSHGTDEEVGVRPLDSVRSAAIESVGGFLIVRGFEQEVRERLKVVAQQFKLGLHLDSGEKLLPDG